MIILRNGNYNNFLADNVAKRIILFGAGGTLHDFAVGNAGKIELLDKIDVILDNNPELNGTYRTIGFKRIPVKTVRRFLSEHYGFKDYVIIILINNHHIMDIVSQLDSIAEFDGIHCFYGITAITWGLEVFPPSPADSSLPQCSRDYKIPKTIHYCWFGCNPIPAMERECIESWSKLCPDYKVIFWNEENYDLSKAPIYVHQAYEAGKYSFVTDFVRLDVVYQYGGFYLDTDVELVKSLDAFNPFKSVFAFEHSNLIATGLGFGSTPRNPVIRELRDLYNDMIFINDDGSQNKVSCPIYHTDFFRRRGIDIRNNLQLHDEMLFLPSDYLCPLNQFSTLYELTGNTYGIHKFSCSWFEAEQLDKWEKTKQETATINERLLRDWKNVFYSR